MKLFLRDLRDALDRSDEILMAAMFFCLAGLVLPLVLAILLLLDMPRGFVRGGVMVLYAAAFAAGFSVASSHDIANGWQDAMLDALVGYLALGAVAIALVTVTWTIPTVCGFLLAQWRERSARSIW